MKCFGTLPGTRTDYKAPSGLDTTDPGLRLALRDDWCEIFPIITSNIISMGGPLNNYLAQYFNDFTDAFYGLDRAAYDETFTKYADWKKKGVALPSWDRSAFEHGKEYLDDGTVIDKDVGYGIIATYKDIDGTIGLLFWGLKGRDGYYIARWFHAGGIHDLQDINDHVTSIILKIDYSTDYEHPEVTIVKKLDTISEKPPEIDC